MIKNFNRIYGAHSAAVMGILVPPVDKVESSVRRRLSSFLKLISIVPPIFRLVILHSVISILQDEAQRIVEQYPNLEKTNNLLKNK